MEMTWTLDERVWWNEILYDGQAGPAIGYLLGQMMGRDRRDYAGQAIRG
jgi:hypothetical protein